MRSERTGSGRGAGRAAVLLGLCVVLAVSGWGCQFKGGPRQWLAAEGIGVWEPGPREVRLLPSTRWVDEGSNRAGLEARLEFLDEMDDPTKAVGEVRFELFAVDGAGRPRGSQLYRWQVELYTLGDQRRYYDAVTQAYQFTLRIDESERPAERVLVRAVYTPAEDLERLQAERVVE